MSTIRCRILFAALRLFAVLFLTPSGEGGWGGREEFVRRNKFKCLSGSLMLGLER